jgi:SOS-response transcriptional repressor LexA
MLPDHSSTPAKRAYCATSPVGRCAQPTARQRELLGHLGRYLSAHGRAPTFREALDLLGLRSHAAGVRHVEALEALGFVERRRFEPRGLALTAKARLLAKEAA